MPNESFRRDSAAFLPGRRRRKQRLLLALALILAGCGGSGGGKPQTVRGDGYRFEAPDGWRVKRTTRGSSAVRGDVSLVGVSTFRLQKPYRTALFSQASRELDRVAAELAVQLHAKVASSRTVRAGGGRARSYRLELGDRVEELTFVLRGVREYQLLCRRPATDSDEICLLLRSSFALR